MRPRPICSAQPRRRSCTDRLARVRVTCALVWVAVLGTPVAQAQPPGPGWVPPGQWNFWRQASERAASGAPAMSVCLTPAGARDPAVLAGEAPGDGSCKVRAPRRLGADALAADLECSEGRRVRALVRFSGSERFVTRLETVAGRPSEPNPVFVHAQRAGDCP